MSSQKHQLDSKGASKVKKRKVKPLVEGSGDDILNEEVKNLIRTHSTSTETRVGDVPADEEARSFSKFEEIEVDIIELGSSGRAIVIPMDGRPNQM